MLYNLNQSLDELNILEYVNTYTETIGLAEVEINTVKLRTVCNRIRKDFPCCDGIEKASIFKKAAVFVACFVEESPINPNGFEGSMLADSIIDKNPNAIIALDIAFKFMSLAKVKRSDDVTLIIKNGIELSMHSYCDFLDMLSQGVQLNTHFMPLSLLFEQIVYKTHGNMQYERIDFALESEDDVQNSVYTDQVNVPEEWDDQIKFWMDLNPKDKK